MSLLQRPERYLLIFFCTLSLFCCTQADTQPNIETESLTDPILSPYDNDKISAPQNQSKKQPDAPLSIVSPQFTNIPLVSLKDEKGPWILGIDTTITFQADKMIPLIIYLHGGIGTQKSDKGSRAYEMMQFLNKNCDDPFLLASPSGNREAPWWSATGKERILTAVKYLTTHYNIDSKRIYLAGVSDGGTGVFAMATETNHPFAAFVSISGFGGMLPQLGITLQKESLQQSPIYMINAGRDHLYPLAYVKQFANTLLEAKIPLKTSYHPNEKHGFSYREKERKNLQSFLQHRKK